MMEKSSTVLQEATSQLPPETPIEDVIVPEDVDVQIVNEVLNQKLGRRHGKVVRCVGKAGVRETGASSSKSSTAEVTALKEEVTTLKGQLVTYGEHIRAQDERMRRLAESLMRSGLQVSMEEPDFAPPSTSQNPADSQ